MNRLRTALAAAATGIAIAGGVFGVWAVLDYILNAPMLTQFIIASAGSGAGMMAAWVSAKER
jgi:hypothetical protein